MTLEERCRKIKLILSDVDGVLTDGGIIFDNQGIESKRFHVRDGLGIRIWQQAGNQFGIITARSSHVVKLRASELGINIVRQGFSVKLPVVKEVIAENELLPEQVCYIGDDLSDLSAIKYVGLGVAVSNTVEEVKAIANHTSTIPGGFGAVRETIEVILKAQRLWDELVRKF